MNPRLPLAVDPEMPHRSPREEGPVRMERVVEVASKAKPGAWRNILASAALVLAGTLAYWMVAKGPPSVSVASADAGLAARFDKQDAQMDELRRIAGSQAVSLATLTVLAQTQDARVKALEQWRDGERSR